MDAYENARSLCEQHYSLAPLLHMQCINTVGGGTAHPQAERIRLAAVPLHLYYIVFELMKNAMRATIETHARTRGGDDLPPITVRVVLGRENLSIKIADQGGGVPQSKLEHLFHYLYSTAPKPRKSQSGSGPGLNTGPSTPFAGYGYGLPISRLYARYFLGDLFLFSADGWGTDACVHLKASTDQASELLPVYSGTSRSRITSSKKAPDWCYQVPRHNGNGSNGTTETNGGGCGGDVAMAKLLESAILAAGSAKGQEGSGGEGRQHEEAVVSSGGKRAVA